MQEKKERGAIVMEASIALTAFMFLILTLLQIVNIYYIQGRVGVALNAAAKDLSQYSFLYFKLGMNDVDAAMSADTDGSRQSAYNTIDNLSTLQSSITGLGTDASNMNFEGIRDGINNGIDAGSAIYDEFASQLADDPSGVITGMGLLALDEFAEEGKSMLASALGKAFMEKNLVSSSSDNADAFLRRYHVDGGMGGLDFNYTTFLPGGKSSYIQLVVSYDVQVIKLLNIDFKFHFRQSAVTSAWATGISKMHPETNVAMESGSVWDYGSDYIRQQFILNQERKEYPYVATGQGFDAYNNNEDKNEFVSIVTLNTGKEGDDKAMSQEDITSSLERIYNGMESRVSELGETIVVQDHKGKDQELHSDPDTRTYTIVLVIPDDASKQDVEKAVEQFKKDHPGVNVEIHSGYGNSPGNNKSENDDSGGSDEGGSGGSD